ncbi:hypothetical protein CHH59_12620 [Shouchella clausii]|uniref:RusA family crossover junction endodeoxyribonuclease n=1 Tax=Shouchella clausii TaxID=79880 RepID=UPI000BA6788B|nr:hypothetical protein CHH59_12620 [Shouchella clausii]
MANVIEFTIDGEVQAQGRPRAGKTKYGKTTMYDPPTSRNYKQYVKLVASQYKPETPYEGEIELFVTVYKQIPKSMPKWRQELARAGKLRPVTKPDLDNYVKGIKDGMTGIIWRDDNQVTRLVVEKKYSDSPRAEIKIIERPLPERKKKDTRGIISRWTEAIQNS